MATPDFGRAPVTDRRLLETLERVLTIDELDLRGALSAACTLAATALGADKVDVFVYEAESEALVALGTSHTEMGRRERQIGMDRQPLVNGGVAVEVFRNGKLYHSGQVDEDPEQLRGMVECLSVRSEIAVPLEVRGCCLGGVAAARALHRHRCPLLAGRSWLGRHRDAPSRAVRASDPGRSPPRAT